LDWLGIAPNPELTGKSFAGPVQVQPSPKELELPKNHSTSSSSLYYKHRGFGVTLRPSARPPNTRKNDSGTRRACQPHHLQHRLRRLWCLCEEWTEMRRLQDCQRLLSRQRLRRDKGDGKDLRKLWQLEAGKRETLF